MLLLQSYKVESHFYFKKCLDYAVTNLQNQTSMEPIITTVNCSLVRLYRSTANPVRRLSWPGRKLKLAETTDEAKWVWNDGVSKVLLRKTNPNVTCSHLCTMGKCKFNYRWLENSENSAWLKPAENQYEARCNLCKKTAETWDVGCKIITVACKVWKTQNGRKRAAANASHCPVLSHIRCVSFKVWPQHDPLCNSSNERTSDSVWIHANIESRGAMDITHGG